jgi:hypothetical protein
MIQITDNKQSLEVVRLKCTKRQTDFNADELRHLNLVWLEVNKKLGKQHTKPLDQSCSYCVITAMNTVHNYIMFEEPKHGTKEIKLNEVDETKDWDSDNTYPEKGLLNETPKPTLKELRAAHPHIKATSVEVFLQKLNEQD